MIHQKSQKMNIMAILGLEKSLIERNYTFLTCKIEGSVLYCYGSFQPSELSEKYDYRIKYDGISRSNVQVRAPKIEYDDNIHMYPNDNSLCLFHSSDLKWSSKSHLFDTIIPWTHEWFVFYEIYKITGIWEHPFVPHINGEKKDV